MHQTIQLIRIKVCQLKIYDHIGDLSPTICGLFLFAIVKELLPKRVNEVDFPKKVRSNFELVWQTFQSLQIYKKATGADKRTTWVVNN